MDPKAIIIDKTPDGGYRVYYYNNADGSATIIEYKNIDDLSKILSLDQMSGLSKPSDRMVAYFNDQGSVDRLHFTVDPRDKDTAPEEKIIQDEQEIHADKVDDLKTELDSKVPHK